MKSLLFIFIISFYFAPLAAQDTMKIKSDSALTCKSCFCNIVSVGGKYYFNTLKNTRKTLADNGFLMDQEAFEYQVRFYNLPKLFYFQQLGTLSDGNYTSITGVGLKEDIRFPLFKNSNFVVTPYVELGGGYYRMSIAKGVKSNTIASVLGSQVENYFLDNFVISGDLGLEIGYGFDIDDRRLSILFNGGIISNVPAEWRLASSLAFKEKINLTSPYAGVTVKLDFFCSKCGDSMCK
ncbi:MAG: hypothetical protein IPO92_00775 [Saprospiraceae bacterium]|nr:hypothetical protein [Saprospiraceae bacterium]